jgi:hypothetical protein
LGPDRRLVAETTVICPTVDDPGLRQCLPGRQAATAEGLDNPGQLRPRLAVTGVPDSSPRPSRPEAAL